MRLEFDLDRLVDEVATRVAAELSERIASEASSPWMAMEEAIAYTRVPAGTFRKRYTDRAVGGPIPNQRWHCTFETVRGGTRVTRAVDVESTGFLKLLEPLQKRAADRQLQQDLRMLKHVLEGP